MSILLFLSFLAYSIPSHVVDFVLFSFQRVHERTNGRLFVARRAKERSARVLCSQLPEESRTDGQMYAPRAFIVSYWCACSFVFTRAFVSDLLFEMKRIFY